ncbi:MAG: DUF1080 domain-containing protein [Chitinophagaceae bacterium]
MTKEKRFISVVAVLVFLLAGSFQSAFSQTKKGKFVKIFNGKSFKGWEADTAFWKIKDGVAVGQVLPGQVIKTNTFLIWKGGEPADFEFKALYRISPEGNSGVQYRSEAVKDVPHALKGYQADIDGANTYTGQNYEERGRGFLAMRGQKVILRTNEKPLVTDSVSLGGSESLKALIKSGWNEIHIIAKGNKMQHYVNGVLMSEAIEEDTVKGKSSGLLGMQVHVMPKMKVEYKEIYLKEL